MAHASMTGIGRNPLTVIGRFLEALESAPQPDDPQLGRATIAPTLIRTDQTSANVIPGELFLTLDCRTVPGQSTRTLREDLLPLLERCAIDGTSVDIFAEELRQVSYTGYEMTFAADNPAYAFPADHPAIRSAATVLADSLGAEPAVDVWQFATDGGHFAVAGRTVVGFGPGDDRLAHTIREHIEIEALAQGMHGNEALARGWPARLAAIH
jgi:acetylornithine deacetylase/succinyl-diaminopimelate desuccinylase-like protein